jgi:hypothetical protein
MRILFLHGWQSIPGGVKATFLKESGHDVMNPELPDDNFEEALRIAQTLFETHAPRMNMKTGDAALVLLCPAWKKYGAARTVKPGTLILHSRLDETIPFADSEELIRNSRLPHGALIEVGSDHRLADLQSLHGMLAACERHA